MLGDRQYLNLLLETKPEERRTYELPLYTHKDTNAFSGMIALTEETGGLFPQGVDLFDMFGYSGNGSQAPVGVRVCEAGWWQPVVQRDGSGVTDMSWHWNHWSCQTGHSFSIKDALWPHFPGLIRPHPSPESGILTSMASSDNNSHSLAGPVTVDKDGQHDSSLKVWPKTEWTIYIFIRSSPLPWSPSCCTNMFLQ